jgi:hypothetical protein
MLAESLVAGMPAVPVDGDLAACENAAMKRRYLIAACILATGIIAVLAVLVTLPETGVTKAKFERVEQGWTVEAIESEFGMPATETVGYTLSTGDEHVDVIYVWKRWRNEDGSGADVCVTRGGIVYGKEWRDSEETMGQKLKRWVRWPWW